jgi:hypothetical protein
MSNTRPESLCTRHPHDGAQNHPHGDTGGKYSALRTLAKIGGYFSSGPVSAGLAVTTPSVHITGSGELGVNDAEFTADTTVLRATVQTDLPAEFKSPLSVALGLGWQIGKARLNASGEWFDRIDPYVVMKGEEYVQQIPQEVRQPDLVQSGRGIQLGPGTGIRVQGVGRRIRLVLDGPVRSD